MSPVSTMLCAFRHYPAIGILTLLSTGFILILLLEVILGQRMPDLDEVSVQPQQTETLLSTSGIRQSRRAFNDIIQRPIFYENRAALTAARRQTSAISDWRLTGVVITPGKRIALLENPKLLASRDPKQQAKGKIRGAIGDKLLSDWELIELEKTYAKFQRGNKIEQIDLKNEQEKGQGKRRNRMPRMRK
jgi:hypothetical protein